jgi:hypothetical protein
MKMQVPEVDIAFAKPRDGLVAFASVVLDDEVFLSGIAIHQKLVGSGYRLTYPTRKVGETQFSLFIRFESQSVSPSSRPSSRS